MKIGRLFVGLLILMVGVYATLSNSIFLGIAAEGNFSTEGYEKDGMTYTWEETIQENVPGVKMAVFQNINGKVEIEPNREQSNTIELVAVVKIKKGVFTSEAKVMEAKKSTGIEVRRDGSEILFKVKQPKWKLFGGPNVSIAMSVKMPQEMDVNAKTVNGSVCVSGMASMLALETVNGKVKTDAGQATVKANTVNGSIDIVHAMEIESLKTVNGSIKANVSALSNRGVHANTVNGSITLNCGHLQGIDLDAKTVNGRIRIPVATFEGESKKNVAVGKLNGGGPKVNVRATNGSIEIKSEI